MARKAYIGVENFKPRNIPNGYTQVEYIESSGTQYIDTMFVPNQDTRVVMEVEHTVTYEVSWLFGVRTASGKNTFAFLAYRDKYRTDYNTTTSSYYDTSITAMTHVDKNKNITTLNGTEVITQTYAAFNCQYSLLLLAMNTAGTASGFASVKLKKVCIYDNGTLVRDLVPCRRDSDREVGLYDMVNGAFYANAGTGMFICPEPPMELPQGYTQVTYIEATGTQYINTGFIANQDTSVTIDFEVTDTTATSWLFCGRKSSSADAYGVYAYKGGTSFYVMYGAERNNFAGDPTKRQICKVIKNQCSIGDTTVTAAEQTFTSSVPLCLLVRNTNGTIETFATAKVYSCQIYDNGTLIRDYVPCINANGVAGLYDMVNDVFYENAGTGSFLTGNEVHNEVARAVSKMYIGIDNLARKIKKAYIGIGGIARPFFDITKLTYYGTIDPLSSERYYPGVITIGDYALIGGGTSSNKISSGDVDAYNKSLTKTTAKSLAYDKSHPPTARSSVHAFFGGAGGDHFSSTSEGSVDAYDASLTRFSPSSHRSTGPKAATQVNDYVLFGGGYDDGTYYDDVYVYNTSLTYTVTSLSLSRFDILGAYNKNYGLFIGGTWSNSGTTRVDAYDATLTRTTPFACNKESSVSTTFFDYILIGAGWDETYIEIYDPSFTKTILTESINDWSGMFSTATTLNEYALFVRGGDVSIPFLEAYDKSFTKQFYIEDPNGGDGGQFVTIGNYSLLIYGSEVNVYTMA